MRGTSNKTFKTTVDHIKEITTTTTTKMVMKRMKTKVNILIIKTIINIIKTKINIIKAAASIIKEIINTIKEITSIIKVAINIIRIGKIDTQERDTTTITETIRTTTMINLTTHTINKNLPTSRNQILHKEITIMKSMSSFLLTDSMKSTQEKEKLSMKTHKNTNSLSNLRKNPLSALQNTQKKSIIATKKRTTIISSHFIPLTTAFKVFLKLLVMDGSEGLASLMLEERNPKKRKRKTRKMKKKKLSLLSPCPKSKAM